MQETLMRFDPATGEPRPYPSHAEQWRLYHGFTTAWLFNPWDGSRRGAGDVGTDPLGRAMVPPGSPTLAAMLAPVRSAAGVDGTDSAKAIAKAASLVGGVLRGGPGTRVPVVSTASDPSGGGAVPLFHPEPTGAGEALPKGPPLSSMRGVLAKPKRAATKRRR